MICDECETTIQGGVISTKDIISLNKKLLGRQVNRFFCESCLAEYLDIETDDLLDIVQRFKEQGCKLF